MTTTPTLRDAAQRLLKAIEGVRQAEASQGHGRNGFIRTAPTHEHQRRVAEAWRKQANAADHLRAALAEQAAEQAEPVAWRTSAAAWLRQRADQQRKTNAAYPEHVKCYPSWEKRVRDLEWLADDLEREQTSSPPAPALQEWQPPTDSQLEQLFDAAHEHGQFGREFLEHARTILAAQGEQTKE